MDDPAKATGTEAEINASFEQAYQILRKRIEAFLALPTNIFNNPSELQAQLNRIGMLS